MRKYSLLLLIALAGIAACKEETKPGQSGLIGRWMTADRVPVWEFQTDSIISLDRATKHAYKLSGDTLRVQFSNEGAFTDFGTVRIVEDTLFIKQYYANDMVVAVYRAK